MTKDERRTGISKYIPCLTGRNKEITPELIRRTDNYNEQFVTWYMNRFSKLPEEDRKAFREEYGKEFPVMLDSRVHDRMAIRSYFNKYIYRYPKTQYRDYYETERD